MLDKYRIVKSNMRDRYHVQYRTFLFFWMNIGFTHKDLRSAKNALQSYKAYDEERQIKKKERWRRCC